jgi:hypothetical protein
MKTGIEQIEAERKQQIRKHGFTKKHDQQYTKGQLVEAALGCIERVGRGPGFIPFEHPWPEGWMKKFNDKIRFKDDVGKLVVAGAFYMAEQDRIGKSHYYATEIREIATWIDRLQP